jgi:multisubunit Na+/H+ antiporter MnhB subunit
MPRLLFDIGLVAAAAALARVLFTLPPSKGELPARVAEALPASGVEHPVTAVLLNFRGYDTFLEMLVLLLALAGVRGMGALPRPATLDPPGAVLEALLRMLAPLLVLVSAYLLWVGKQAPGGAFQAGAVLGAAGVLLLLTDRRIESALPAALLRLTLVLGVMSFGVLGIIFGLSNGAFLAYPESTAGTWIFVIELLATLSIAATLVMLFIGVRTDEAGP